MWKMRSVENAERFAGELEMLKRMEEENVLRG